MYDNPISHGHYNFTDDSSGGTCVRSGRRCQWYLKPGDIRLPIAPAMLRPLRPLIRDASVKPRDQFLAAGHSPMHGKDFNAPPYLRGEIPESAIIARSFSHNRLGDTPPASSTVSSNHDPLSKHAFSSHSHPAPQKWTIPSIHELLQDTQVGNELPPVVK